MQYVLQATAKQIADMFVVKRVVHVAAILARAHQPHLSQVAQVMRDGRFADVRGPGQRTDVLFAFNQSRQNPNAASMLSALNSSAI